MKRIHSLKKPLEALYQTYHHDYLDSDPLAQVHAFKHPQDQEVAGLISSVFAYGRVQQIQKTLKVIFRPMGDSPYAFIKSFDPQKDGPLFCGMVHRFNNETDLLCLLFALQAVLKQHGSLESLFLKGYSTEDEDIGEALSRFVEFFLQLDYSPVRACSDLPPSERFGFLLPSPRNKSACKRMNMFLRWMVRRDHGLDLGIWNSVSPSQLIIPLDTHLFRLSKKIGLTQRKRADWATAKEVTGNLRLLDSRDPVKYDFALSRLGILNLCTVNEEKGQCLSCLLKQKCLSSQDEKGP